MLNSGNIYLHKILRNTLCWALWEDLFTHNTEEYCMLNTGKIYLHKILRNTVCWTLWKDLFTQNTEEYCMLSTMRFIYTKYWGILLVEHCGNIYLHKILGNTLCWTLWEDLFTQILRYTVCWTLWEDLFTQNTKEYCMLNTVRRCIYIKYWGIVNADHCGKIYLHKILRNTLCWALWEDLFTQNTVYWALWEDLFTHNTEEYFMLNTVGRFIYTKYW